MPTLHEGSAQPCGCDAGANYLCRWHKEQGYTGVGLTTTVVEGGPKGLPTTDTARKALPIWDGAIMYFPKALAAIAEVSRIGNDQHNPGQSLHWNRTKSMDQKNTCIRHMIDDGLGVVFDTDGARHLAKACWRLLAALELSIEANPS